MSLIIIAAVAKNGVIGNGNDLPWHIPSDLKQFKKRTLNSTMIMGRKTWESIGSKPLPKRMHIVISTNPLEGEVNEMVHHVTSLEVGVMLARSLAWSPQTFIIGGQAVYEQAMNFADRMYITHLKNEFEGDRFFPDINEVIWKPVAQTHSPEGEEPYTVTEYVHLRFSDGDFR